VQIIDEKKRERREEEEKKTPFFPQVKMIDNESPSFANVDD